MKVSEVKYKNILIYQFLSTLLSSLLYTTSYTMLNKHCRFLLAFLEQITDIKYVKL